MSANPVYAYLTRRARWPPLRLSIWITFGLACLMVVLGYFVLFQFEAMGIADAWPVSPSIRYSLWRHDLLGYWYDPPDQPLTVLLACFSALAAISNLLVLTLAPVMTAYLLKRYTDPERLRLLRLTPLTPHQFVRGYIAASLHRLRFLIMLAIELAPAFIVSTIQTWTVNIIALLPYARHFRGFCYDRSREPFFCIPRGVFDGPEFLAKLLLAVMGLWGMVWLGATVAAWLTLWWRNPAIAALATLVVVLGLTYAGYRFVIYWFIWSQLIPGGIALFAVPYLLALGAMRLARRYV